MAQNMNAILTRSHISVDALSASDIAKLEFRQYTADPTLKVCTKDLRDHPIVLQNNNEEPPTTIHSVSMHFHVIGEILREGSIYMVEGVPGRPWALFTTVGFWVQGRMRDEFARVQWEHVKEKLVQVADRAGPDVRKDSLYRITANTGVLKVFFHSVTPGEGFCMKDADGDSIRLENMAHFPFGTAMRIGFRVEQIDVPGEGPELRAFITHLALV